MQLERYNFDRFLARFWRGEFAGQRLGQAFFNHYNLHKMRPTPFLDRIYEKDGGEALDMIKQNVEFS